MTFNLLMKVFRYLGRYVEFVYWSVGRGKVMLRELLVKVRLVWIYESFALPATLIRRINCAEWYCLL